VKLWARVWCLVFLTHSVDLLGLIGDVTITQRRSYKLQLLKRSNEQRLTTLLNTEIAIVTIVGPPLITIITSWGLDSGDIEKRRFHSIQLARYFALCLIIAICMNVVE